MTDSCDADLVVPASLWDSKWIVVDTETTGIDPATCGIVELGFVHFERGQPLPERYGRILDPECPIDPAATAVHHIDAAAVAGRPTASETAPAFLWHVKRADVIVGYNIFAFDMPILRRCIPGFSAAASEKPVIDVLVLVRQVGRFWRGPGRHRLTEVARRFRIDVPGAAHRASTDSLLCGLVLSCLRTSQDATYGIRIEELGRDLRLIESKITQWKTEQDEAYRQWKESHA